MKMRSSRFVKRDSDQHQNHKQDRKTRDTFIVESTCKKPKFTITGIAGKKGFCSINIEKIHDEQ